VASLVLLLGAAQAAPALDHGSQTPRASHARLRRNSLSHDDLLVVDAATSAPWTGFAADGGEIEMMPARLLVSFELHGEPQLLHVARTDAFVSSNCRFPSHKLRSNFSFRGVGVVGVRHGDCPACIRSCMPEPCSFGGLTYAHVALHVAQAPRRSSPRCFLHCHDVDSHPEI